MKLLSKENPKLLKGEKKGYRSYVLMLLPGNMSGVELCPCRSKECFDNCLGHSTHFVKQFPAVYQARKDRCDMYLNDREGFMVQLHKEIESSIRSSEKADMIPCFRLNGCTDILWEREDIMGRYPDVQFYDYTKISIDRRLAHMPANYHLTYSFSGTNETQARKMLALGYSVAVVFRDKAPEEYWGYPVHDGDETDLRFLDPKAHIIALTPKGTLKQDTESLFFGELYG